MTDPIKKLPSELIVPIFSPLSTPQLCLMTGVNHEWRAVLQSDTILFRVIDLLDVKKPLSEKDMKEVLERLCQLSTHHGNELLLDITNFWYSFCELASKHSISSEQVMFNKPNGFHSLLSAIAIERKEKLDKLVLHVRSQRRPTANEDAFARAIINGLGRLTSMMTGVRELDLYVPCSPISVQSRAPGKRGKACSIRSELFPGLRPSTWQVSECECKVFLEIVVAFTGANLTHLGFCTGSFQSVEKLYKVIHLHKDSLTHLELQVEVSNRPQLALQMAAQCQNLSSVRLSFVSEDEDYYDANLPNLFMSFPQDASISKLREFEFISVGTRIGFPSHSFLNWLGKRLEVFKLSGWYSQIPLKDLQLIFSSNPLLKVIKLNQNQVEGISYSDSFVPSSLRLTNLRCLELRSESGHGLKMFSAAFLPALESLSVQQHPDDDTYMKAGFHEQLFPIFQCCRLSLRFVEVDGPKDWLSNIYGSYFRQVPLEFPRLEQLDLHVGSNRLTQFCRSFQLSSSRLRTLKVRSRDSRQSDESDEGGSILHAIRFLDSSSMTIEVVSLSLSHSHLNFDLELGLQTGMVRAFPKLKSLKLNWESKAIVDYFSSSSFGELEVLELSHYESKTSQAYQEECLKRAISIVELNSASLREIEFRGFEKATEYTPEISSFKLPKLKVLCIEVTSPDLVQFFLDHSQGVCLSELTLHALPKSNSLDGLLRVILPMSTSLRRLALRDISFGQDEIESSQEQHQVSSFPILTSLSINGENLNLLEILAQYQYPLLYELYVWARRGTTETKISQIKNLFSKNAPNLSPQDLERFEES